MSQSVLTNAAVASLGRILNVTLGIAVTAALTRYLGVAEYGLYTLLLSVGAMLLIVADFGLYLTLSREISEHPTQAQTIFSQIFSIRLVLLAAVLGAGLLASQLFLPSAITGAVVILALGFAFQSISQLLMAIHQARGVIWRATAGDLAGRLIQLGGILGVLLVSHRLFSSKAPALLAAVIFFTLGGGVALLVHRVLLPAPLRLRFGLAWNKVKPLMLSAWPLALMLLLNAVYFRIDIVILSFFHPAEQVGFYGLAYKIVESALFFPAMLGGLLLPVLSASSRQPDLTRVRGYLQEALQLMLLTGLFLLVVLLGVPAPLIIFLSGSQFVPAAPLLATLSLALFIMFFGNIFGFTLVAFKRQRALLKLYVVLVVVNLIGNLLLIPRYGALAAAWTTVATEAIAASLAGFLVWKIVAFSLSPRFIAWACATALLTAAILSALPPTWPVLIRIGIAAGIFCVVAAAGGIIQPRKYPRLISRHSALT